MMLKVLAGVWLLSLALSLFMALTEKDLNGNTDFLQYVFAGTITCSVLAMLVIFGVRLIFGYPFFW